MSGDAKQEISILMPDPIKITLGGKEFEVKKMSVKKQFQAGAIFEQKAQDGSSEVVTAASMADRMIKIISLVTGIPEEMIDDASTVAEVSTAFKAIWAQNGFDRFTQKPADQVQA